MLPLIKISPSEFFNETKNEFSKPKKILSFSSVENISVSSDYKYLTIDYYDYNKTLPKLITKIYDLETKKLYKTAAYPGAEDPSIYDLTNLKTLQATASKLVAKLGHNKTNAISQANDFEKKIILILR